MSEFDSRYVSLSNGTKLHLYEAGKADQSIVFVPGWTMPAEIWLEQVSFLSPHYRVFSVSLGAHGRSSSEGEQTLERYASELVELLAVEKVSSPVLVGWSMGAIVLLQLAKLKGRDLKGLVLVDGMRIGAKSEDNPSGFSPHYLQQMSLELRRDSQKFAEGFVRGLGKKAIEEADVEKWKELSLATPFHIAVSLLDQMLHSDPNLYQWAKQIPTLLIARDSTRDAGECALQCLDKGKLSVFEGAGHGIFLDYPQEFSSTVINWIESL